MVASPLPSQSPQGGEGSTWLYNRYLLGVPMVGRDQYDNPNPAFRGPDGGEKSIWLHNPRN